MDPVRSRGAPGRLAADHPLHREGQVLAQPPVGVKISRVLERPIEHVFFDDEE